MKALTLKNNGGIENLSLQETEDPKIGAEDVLVRVKAISINPVDAYVRQNKEGMNFFLKPVNGEQIIIGWDIAGTVVAKGKDVTRFSVGDEVFGLVNFPGHAKGYAEYVAAPAHHLTHKPGDISFEEAAAATLAALTAWQALVTHANVRANDKVVIYAAAGGVGHYAVQIAKALGAYVVAVTSRPHFEFIKELGADLVIDYKTEKPEDLITDADVVIDSIGGDNLLKSLQSLRNGGRLVSLLSYFEGAVSQSIETKSIHAVRMVVSSNGKDMNEIAKLLATKKLRSHISQKFTFAELPAAHQQIESRKTKGKIVVSLQ